MAYLFILTEIIQSHPMYNADGVQVRNELLSSNVSSQTRESFIEILVSRLPETERTNLGSDATRK